MSDGSNSLSRCEEVVRYRISGASVFSGLNQSRRFLSTVTLRNG